ncbi:MAG: PEP-CTERM sorting domain-containing protein [Acidobacteria bacterium]|nr:PEP-CTERM sorting domain-containing protein [Acidobacteriota bacterium]
MAQLPDPGNNLLGLEFFTIGTLNFLPAVSGGGVAQVFMQVSGNQNEAFTGTMPLAYDFTLTGTITSWTLGYSVSQASGAGTSGFINVFGSGSGLHTGTAAFPNAVALVATGFTNVNFLLTVNYTGSGASVTIPQNSIDFNAAAATVPEPSTAALGSLALALVGGWRLVRRRKGFLLVRSKD